jgi:hypothetical protein
MVKCTNHAARHYELPLVSCYCLPVRVRYSPSTLFSDTFNVACVVMLMRETMFTPIQNYIYYYYYYYYYYCYYWNFSLLSFQLGNIHLSWDIIINRNRLYGLIYNLESFLQLNMCQELQIFELNGCHPVV